MAWLDRWLLRVIAVAIVSNCVVVLWAVLAGPFDAYLKALAVTVVLLLVANTRLVLWAALRSLRRRPGPTVIDLDRLYEDLGGRPVEKTRIDAEGKIID